MRALIRASLQPASVFDQLWNDYDNYRSQIIRLFREIGYVPKFSAFDGNRMPKGSIALANAVSDSRVPPVVQHSGQANGSNDEYEVDPNWKEVTDIFEDVPDDLKVQEMQHLIMLGYSGEGQGNFVVCAINPTELHIRFRQGLFERLRMSSEGICQKIEAHRQKPFHRIWHRMFDKGRAVESAYLKLKPDIDVLEPHRDNATIVGHIIQNATKELLKTYYREIGMAFVMFGIAVYLFFTAPSLASKVQARWFPTYTAGYIQGAIERIYSAFLVTTFISGLDLGMKWFEYKKNQPIRWNSGIDAIRERRK